MIGQGATVCFYTDRVAGTVVEHDSRVVTVQRDQAHRVDDYGKAQGDGEGA